MKKYTLPLLIVGAILMIFTSLYFIPQPALWSSWDFSNTGQIGDTIGGITAPVINLIGAILVYISFDAQREANKIQAKALADEKANNLAKNQFEKLLLSFDEIKKRLNALEYYVEHPGQVVGPQLSSPSMHVKHTGLNAINEYVEALEKGKISSDGGYAKRSYHNSGMELTFKYLLKATSDLIERVFTKLNEMEDKEFLLKEISLFYYGFLEKFANRIIIANRYEEESITELNNIKDKIEKYLKDITIMN